MPSFFSFEFKTRLTSILIRLLGSALLCGIVIAQARVPDVQAQGGTPQLILTKSVEGSITTAQVGDVIRYRIRFECSSLVGPCGQMEITDVLQSGLTYLPPPDSSVPAGFTITEAPAGTITITKDDNNLLDGSQYDAVIAVRVNYDLRPLPQDINNIVNGRIDPPGPTTWINATPSSAPPIHIGVANAYWGVTKTLVSPRINPTVDTDVTYQIQLCPTTPPPGEGNVPLSNITITDTLPAGAVFVSATNGGVESPTGTVTWSIAGPVYPPNCVARYVTIRYPSPTFAVGDTVINNASATADYLGSDGNPCPTCYGSAVTPITHPIDPISEVPTYSKSDTGDPIGFTATGRFILNLNTNNTNYPTNEAMLIDNLPPELRVFEVTSGGWDASFDYVRAYVEYSTNYGSTYTAFPGQPISYNTNGVYLAPVDNITNVRWRFEYDSDGVLPFDVATTKAGLPYTWSFTTSPEIDIHPRTVATTADPPSGAVMPAAVAGPPPSNTYTNCLQVSRRDSSNTVVTDPCNNEPLTIQGNIVHLRTYKDETPGTSWDDLYDPLINTFTADGTILPGDTLKYTITVEVTERSSAPLINPTIRDTLPPAADFVFVRNGKAQLDGVDLPPAQQPTFSQPGPGLLQWEWNNPSPTLTITPLTLGSHKLTVEFFAYIPRGQAPNTYTNNLYVVTDSVDMLCEIPTQVADAGDVDADGNTTEPACQNPDTYVVERSAALRGEKWIRSTDAANSQVVDSTNFLPDPTCPNGGTVGLPGGGSNPFTRYPCISQAFPEGALSPGQFAPPPPAINPALDDFEYNLRIFNDGNVDMLSYVLYDILPYVGDTGSGGTLSSSSRFSEFRPILRGPVAFVSGPPTLSAADFIIEYNNTTNPCRPEVFNQPAGSNVPASCDNTWTTTWSASARSYRIRLKAGSLIPPATTTSELRFGVPMYIPADAPPVGVVNPDDALTKEIAWNSFSHVGSYDKNPSSPPVVVQDLLASEPRKVGITIPEVMSVGNRVWRDSDNSGTINAPDNSNPGIANVTVYLYRDVNNDGIADGGPTPIATTITDSGGYYLFSNIPYDSADMNNNRYIIGIPASNFAVGQPLESLRSSTGTPAVAAYTNPPSNNGDRNDNGIDTATPGQEVFSASFTLQPATEPTAETDLSGNNRDGPTGTRRGVNGERDNNSDLTIDFGFFGGTDIPFSIGNHVWYDNGSGGGVVNDGIRQSNEPPVVGVTVRLYRDGNANGIPEPAEMIRTDVTDANGFYLFDNLDPGPYYVEIPASEFAAGKPLAGWFSSQPTGTQYTGVPGNTNTPNMDSDDNGIDSNTPDTTGIFSGVVILARGVNEPTGETHISGQADPGPPTNQGYSPTGWDGPLSRGRFGETDVTSNLTIDFGFIPPMSLGNRVWVDEGAGTTPYRTGYNNGLQDGSEAGASGVRVQLWRDTNGTPGLQTGSDTLIRTTTTDAAGYYLFDNLGPGNNYYVQIPAWNFAAAGRPLWNYVSSFDANQTTPPADDTEDMDDDGIDNANPVANGITSPQIVMAYNSEPRTAANETDIPPGTPGNIAAYGADLRGRFGQADRDSNLTMDFGFIRPPRSLGNRLWLDSNNNGQIDAGELPVPTGVRVSLYLDANGDNQPDGPAIATDITDASGYYLFDDLPPNTYIVGVDRSNFASGGLLEGYASSTGGVDNASNNTDSLDNGVDSLQPADLTASPYGILSTRIDLTATPVGAPTGEAGSGDTSTAPGFNPTAGDGTNSRGRFGETDANSDLTIDFGFFKPMSIGNRVFRDDGAGSGTSNNGIMDGGETPIANVRLELWSDTNGMPGLQTTGGAPDTFIGFDITDAGGYYLFDRLLAGNYYVYIPSGNFTAAFDPDGGGPLPSGPGALLGLNSSIPTGTEDTGVTGNPYTPNTDRDDNGVNNGRPDLNGIASGIIVLTQDVEPTSETELSGQTDPGPATNASFNPTGWDGPNSRGRWNVSDNNSNLTIDFGFYPVFSLGNRVWYDTNNNSAIDGTETGANGVTVQLFASDGVTEIPVGPDGVLGTADDAAGGMLTDANGHYLFNNLPGGSYIVSIPASNFGVGAVLNSYWSSATTRTTAGAITETTADLANSDVDSNDNGTRGPSGAVTSSVVTLGPATNSEPSGETDLAAGGQGQPDTQANMTVDFGFYTMRLGDLVWGDANNDGLTPGESGLDNVDVQLWSADLSTLLGTSTTSGGGLYSFTGLPQGDYIVRIPAAEFNPGGTLRDYVSSTGTLVTAPSTYQYEPAPSAETNTTNSDDNGTAVGVTPGPDGTYNSSLGLGGYVQSSLFALTPVAESSFDNSTGLTTEDRVDFGMYVQKYANLTVTKGDGTAIYIAGQTLTYLVTVTNNGPSDVTGAAVTDARPPQIASWTWTCDGSAPDLSPATYACSPDASNPATFTDSLDLPVGASVTYKVSAIVNSSTAGLLTNTASVSVPVGVTETNPADNTSSDADQFASLVVTKDDHVVIVSPNAPLTYSVVIQNNGAVDLANITATDTLPPDVDFVSASIAPTSVVGNVLTWSGLSLTAGSSMTITVNVKVKSAASAATMTNTVTVLDTVTGATHTASDTDAIGVSLFDKTMVSTDAAHTTDPKVAIGEIATYELKLSIPAGATMDNVTVVDTPQDGLAFVDCEDITAGPNVTSTTVALNTPNNCNHGTTAGVNNPLIENSGGKITFNFGTVVSTDAATQIITIRYRLIVLDVSVNQSGAALQNNAQWTWTGGIFVASAPPLQVVEPHLNISKDAEPKTAVYGSPIAFTLGISHTAQSTANAFDVIVTDPLPSGLAFIPGTLSFAGLAPTSSNYDAASATLTFKWDEFPLGQSAVISFQATFIGPAPITNASSMEWTSLPIDPLPGGAPVQLSAYNIHSTERWYDPHDAAGLNGYIARASVQIVETPPPDDLPSTGFAPGVITELPAMPSDFAYAQTDLVIEIPSLGLKLNIVGVPYGDDRQWNLTWLDKNAGWLENTAFPTYNGNSAITAHNYLSDGSPGPFANLGSLKYGDQIIIHLGGEKYIYDVRDTLRVKPEEVSSVIKHERLPWLTLITCNSYDQNADTYRYRTVVRAVLVSFVSE